MKSFFVGFLSAIVLMKKNRIWIQISIRKSVVRSHGYESGSVTKCQGSTTLEVRYLGTKVWGKNEHMETAVIFCNPR
jgi:hypothetical protein